MAATKMTSKVFILICFSFSFISTRAQQTGNSNEFTKLYIGLSFSPDYNSRTLKNANGGTRGDVLIQDRNNAEIARLGYTTGLNLLIHFSRHLAFETGIQYANKGYQTRTVELTYEIPNSSSPASQKSVYSYRYIGIPLTLQYVMEKGRFGFHTGVGLVPGFLISAKQLTVLEYSDGKRDRTHQTSSSDFKKPDLSAVINFGLDYHISKRLILHAEPAFRYGLLRVKAAPISENLWNGGLNIGFRYGIQ